MTANVIPMKPTKSARPKITPPEGWAVHSPYGVLKTIKGEGLERLEAIHAWQMERDRLLTSADAAVRVFGPFIADANSALGMKHGAAKLRPFLHIVDPSLRANSSGDSAGRKYMATLAGVVPYVQHPHFENGTPEALYYALGVMAGEVWAPHSGDVDLNDRWGDDCPDWYFPPAAKCRDLLGPLAVPFGLAHALWGWGTVEAVASDDVQQPATVPPASDVQPAKSVKVPQREQLPEWPGERLRSRHAEIKKTGSKSPTKDLSVECGLPGREITRRIKDVRTATWSMVSQLKKVGGK